MNDMHDKDLIRWLEQLGEVKPTPQATHRALDRTRLALAATPAVALAAKSKLSATAVSAAAGLALVAGALAGWLWLSSPTDGPRAGTGASTPTSVCYQQTLRVGSEDAVRTRLWIRADGSWRSEKADGSYTVVNIPLQQALVVNHAKHEAALRNFADGTKLTLYDTIKNLPNDPSARRLPARKIDGQDVLGYVANGQGQDVTIWLDAQTLLPLRVECDLKSSDGKIASVVLDQFEFGKDLDASLFALEAPAGYKLTGSGIAQPLPVPATPKLKDAVLTPLVGLGPVKFGMARAEVEALLGTPDATKENESGLLTLSFRSQGLSLILSDKATVQTMVCQAADDGAADFTRKTDMGIAFGASTADIVAAYGQADATETTETGTCLSYTPLRMTFTLIQDKLVQMQINAK